MALGLDLDQCADDDDDAPRTELRPDRDMIVAQMEYWFGDQWSGQIDIGYTDPRDGKLNKFRRFEVSQIEDLADFVVEVNRVPGQSVYFRPALIRPDAPRFVTDRDFMRSTGVWGDLDAAEAVERAPALCSIAPPTMEVITGHYPHTRKQVFWRASEEIGSPEHLRDLNRRIATRLHGDPMVVNQTSLMRVAGTIAWPWKPGRRAEMTELRLNDRKRSFPLLALGRAFPPVAEQPSLLDRPSPPPSDRPAAKVEQPAAKAEHHDVPDGEPSSFDDLLGLRPDVLIARIKAGDQWHNNMLRLVGHWISRGWSNEEILTAAEAMTLPGYTVGQTRAEVGKMIQSGREKWNAPEPDAAVDDDAGGEPERQKWPQPPDDAAFHGLAGAVVATIDPHTEAAREAILIQFLVAFGNALGRGPHYAVEGDRHHSNLFAVLVGDTAKGRKGTSWGRIQQIFAQAAPDWAPCIKTGLSSGEGLIWAVRDPIKGMERVGKGKDIAYVEVEKDPGVADKRLLIQESEFANVLRQTQRDGNTISNIIRDAWDRGTLTTLTKNSPAKATGAHVSIVGHITADELCRYLNRTEAANGFANRFLFVCVKRSKLLPLGGSLDENTMAALAQRVAIALERARGVGAVTMDESAIAAWVRVYGSLSAGQPGLLGAVTGRAEAQVMRLALLYALLDGSAVIRAAHLSAALALWSYCEESARFVFGGTMGDPLADDILAMLRSAGAEGMTRDAIGSALGWHVSKSKLGAALAELLRIGRATYEKQATAGRPREIWRAK